MQSESNVARIQFEKSQPGPDSVAAEQFIREGDGALVGRPPRAADWSPLSEAR
jgi:hypothetical protein